MSKLAVIYWSGTGNTKAMAEAIAEGAKEAGAEVALLNISETTADAAASYDKLRLAVLPWATKSWKRPSSNRFSSSWSPAWRERTSPCLALTAGATVSGCATGKTDAQRLAQTSLAMVSLSAVCPTLTAKQIVKHTVKNSPLTDSLQISLYTP